MGKELTLGKNSLNEMVEQWSANLRTVNMKGKKAVDEEEDGGVGVEKGCRSPGLISRTANRDSYIPKTQGPGPSEYCISRDFPQPKTAGFGWQSSRPETPQKDQVLRDVGEHIDKILSRCPQAIPFTKQSAREPEKPPENEIWQEIEKEQDEILKRRPVESGKTSRVKKKKKKQPFELQVAQVEAPFAHIARKELEPSEPYNVELSRKALDRPATAFDIRQPVLKSVADRIPVPKTDAPDVMCEDLMDQFTNTISRTTSPLPIEREIVRHDPYHYFPHGCGRGDPMTPRSALADNRAVDLAKMGKRKCQLAPPGGFKYPRLYGLKDL
jgi:hypothetical protein